MRSRWLLMYGLLAILNAGDVATTAFFVQRDGLKFEGNPIARLAIAHMGMGGLLLLHFVGWLIVVCVVAYSKKEHSKLCFWLLVALNVCYVLVVLNNLVTTFLLR